MSYPALEALKARISDTNLASLDLARALGAHREAYPQSMRTLADKLGIPQMDTF